MDNNKTESLKKKNSFEYKVKNKVINATVIIIERDELVKDKSKLPDFIWTQGIISNCSKGLCFSPEEAISICF